MNTLALINYDRVLFSDEYKIPLSFRPDIPSIPWSMTQFSHFVCFLSDRPKNETDTHMDNYVTVDSLFKINDKSAIPLFCIKSREYKIMSTKLLI